MLPKLSHLEIKPETLKLIAAIDEFKGAWPAIGRIAPERLSALRRVATLESASSSIRFKGESHDRGVERLLSNLVKSFATRDGQELSVSTSWPVFAHWAEITLPNFRSSNYAMEKFDQLKRHRGA